MSYVGFGFPIKVFPDRTGRRVGRAPECREGDGGLVHAPDRASMAAARRSVGDLLCGELVKRRDNPPDDAFGFALRAQVEGRPLTDDELVGFTFNLFIGGLDTV